MSAGSIVAGLPAAVIFLTRLPVPGRYSEEDFANASAFFPLVGFGIGFASWLVFVACAPLGDPIAACLAVAFAVLITGAMHEDGLADSADALFGGTTRERVLAIAKDPRVGSFGVVALVLVLATRLACVATHPGRAAAGFVLAHVLSRFAATATMASLPYVREPDESKSVSVVATTRTHVLVAGATAAVVVAAGILVHSLTLASALAVVAASALVAVAFGVYVRSRVGGLVGDFLGAIVQLVDLAVWLSLAAVGG